ncbi:Imm50 family immunity protein [Niveibacterium microcysteis]|uniref:Uncharacterized protein n=1 Tax=Niveibacterium microcysteis TaxID=2811415 RepID=A0ABX7M4H4_9RHOO|nr:Imm50 family immunity protein [Niveibacterium microcysteis]QSI76643.1 hypothetical protein JY500_19630 [Niveibacterium microcysteis]
MSTPAHISGASRVIAEFGLWPSFHDAEVVSFALERALPVQAGSCIARMAVHVRTYETLGDGTADYRQSLLKSAVITFAFHAPAALNLDLSEFNNQNVIDSIRVSSAQAGAPAELEVFIEPIWGFGGGFYCAAVEVESIKVLPNAPA